MLEKNPKTTRREVMDALGCGTLQAAAWMQRFKAETEFKKDDSELFKGKYKKGKKPRRVRHDPERKNVVNPLSEEDEL